MGRNLNRVAPRWLLILSICLLPFCSSAIGQALAGESCIAEVVSYSPDGERLPFKLVSMRLVMHKDIELLGNRVDGMRAVQEGSKIHFSGRSLIGMPDVELAFREPGGRMLRTRRPLPACGARVSVISFGLIVGRELSVIRAKGELAGCSSFGSEWWIKVVPLFGETGPQVEAFVERTGRFNLVLPPAPIRQCILVGRGKEIIKALAIDIHLEVEIDLGRIHVDGACR